MAMVHGVCRSGQQERPHPLRLQLALKELDGRSRDILERRWLAEDKPTLHELAAEYEVSAERIRQLEANAMKKLRAAMVA